MCLGFVLALVAPSSASVDAQGNSLSFFITSASPGKGADLGGLAGADAHCAALAKAAGAGNRVWRAYLSTTGADGKPGVNAKDRIGTGPWFNAKGVQVAANVADLHSDNNKLSKENSLNEKGEVNNGRGDTPNRHDILTGSNLDGTAATATCNNWTSSARRRRRAGRPSRSRRAAAQNPTSWNSAHATPGLRHRGAAQGRRRRLLLLLRGEVGTRRDVSEYRREGDTCREVMFSRECDSVTGMNPDSSLFPTSVTVPTRITFPPVSL